MKISVVKNGGRLFPADPEAEETFKKLPSGSPLMAEITRQRNPLFHRKAMAMLRYAFECWNPEKIPDWKNMEVSKDFDRFRHDITILAGFGFPVVNIKGEMRIEAQSLSYSSMDADVFERWYSATIDVLMRVVFNGQEKESVEKQIEEFMKFW